MTTKDNAGDEAKRIIKTAAKIIENELKKILQSNAMGSTTCYPSIDDIKIGWIPDHLRLFFSSIIHFGLNVKTMEQYLSNRSSNAQICHASHVICTCCRHRSYACIEMAEYATVQSQICRIM